ncbi:MAG: DUF5996 family protein [Anaerolineae bacterium]|nr:DUF5996 family protein [Anaerolineae bacterium]MDQ7035344.1 DUF5996 family protein [Anaerolineae bacterium]
MPLPKLDNFQTMIHLLHQAVEIVAPIHGALRERQKNWLHLPMEIQPHGLSSGTYPKGGSLDIDFKKGMVVYHRPNGDSVSISMKLHSQESLFNALLAAMKDDILADFFADIEGDSLAEGFILKRSDGDKEAAAKSLETYNHKEKLVFDTQLSGDYADALYAIFTGVARFRSRLNGHLTPIILWPEHFDLSTLWFRDAAMDESQAHLSFGFAPYTPGQYERPYLYAYAYPYPDDFEEQPLPTPAFWNTTGWKGVVVNYDDIASQENPALFVENLCRDIFAILKPIID